MKLLNPHEMFWLAATPAEIEAWFTRLKQHEESWFDFGDVDDVRPYAVALIRPGFSNQQLVAVVNKKEKVPARSYRSRWKSGGVHQGGSEPTMNLKRLSDRIKALEPKPPTNNSRDRYMALIGGLTEEEEEALVTVMVASEEDHTTPEDEAWLSKRPEQEQAIVRKVLARFKEANTDAGF